MKAVQQKSCTNCSGIYHSHTLHAFAAAPLFRRLVDGLSPGSILAHVNKVALAQILFRCQCHSTSASSPLDTSHQDRRPKSGRSETASCFPTVRNTECCTTAHSCLMNSRTCKSSPTDTIKQRHIVLTLVLIRLPLKQLAADLLTWFQFDSIMQDNIINGNEPLRST